MNIAFLTQITNIEISNKNPLVYLQEYDYGDFENVLSSHLIPPEILDWSRQSSMPENALDHFVEKRADLIIDELRNKLSGMKFKVMDTRIEEEPQTEYDEVQND